MNTGRIELRLSTRRPPLDVRPIAKRVGLIVLSTDHTTEPDFRRMVASDGIGVYVNRIAFTNPTNAENLRAMQPSLGAAAGLILPEEALDVICYSCTSASVVIGDAEVEDAIASGKPGVSVVTPAAAAVRALNRMAARRISILTPYSLDVSRSIAEYFVRAGFQIASFTYLGLEDDREMARISPQALIELAAEAISGDADALFISCTGVRAAGVAAAIEHRISRPVVTSNLATAWNCLRVCGDETPRPAMGTLMTL